MGICGSLSVEEKQALNQSNALDKVLNTQQADEEKIIKVLLLGTGESGKSTIFKQMQILYEEGFSEFEKTTFRHVLRRNVVEAMQTLLAGCERFGFGFENEDSDTNGKFLMELDPLEADFWVDEIVGAINQLWLNEPAIQSSYLNRSKMQLLDSSEYLFGNVERIGHPDYSPNRDDILRARQRTSGIVERTFNIQAHFKFLDVGGQRNERRKWIHCFDGVTAIIFVAAISEFDQTLFEDEKENRLMEAISVFDNICNNPFFRTTAMILFLNKKDIFEDKLKRGVRLQELFPEYNGDNSFEDAAEYVKQQFLNVNQQDKLIFAHLTCATDTTNVEKVFEACKMVILKANLEKLGLA